MIILNYVDSYIIYPRTENNLYGYRCWSIDFFKNIKVMKVQVTPSTNEFI